MADVNKHADFGSAVMDLKTEIRTAIQKAMDAFELRTGATPCSIRVSIIERTAHGDRLGRFCVGDVKVSLGEF